MISIQKALDIIYKESIQLSVEKRPIEKSLGYYLAEEIKAPFDLPLFDNSAMDGYAVCGNLQNYHIVGEVQAGNTTSTHLLEGEAVRIFTGAKVPKTATAVIMQEQTKVIGEELFIQTSFTNGQNIRRKGNELKKFDSVFHSSYLIKPATIGLLTSLGMTDVSVFKKPKISIISTGDELIPAGSQLKDGQIYESNAFTLSSALQMYGFSAAEKLHLKDDLALVKRSIRSVLSTSDVVLLSGGISVGDYDFVRKALEENEVSELFYKVNQKPGKPLYFGRWNNTFVFALPGNPASSLTCFYVYVLPLLQRVSGAKTLGLLRIRLPLKTTYQMKSDRPTFLKAFVENNTVSILDGQASSMIHSMASANALCFIDKVGDNPAGTLVDCIIL
jgi:molybdopterin molybdotransferase